MIRAKLREFSIGLVITIVTVFLTIGLFEIVLRTGLLDDLDDPSPEWIPPRYRAMDQHTNDINHKRAYSNQFGFNGPDCTVGKPAGTYRIALIGDSFVWGDGLPLDQDWCHKLERLVTKEFTNAEVFCWGICGWSTRHQLEFLRSHAREYGINRIIVGFVSNDPDRGVTPRTIRNLDGFTGIQHFRAIFPLVESFVNQHYGNLLYRLRPDYGYAGWERRLYTKANLDAYALVLDSIASFSVASDIPVLFALTPCTSHDYYRDRFDYIKPLLARAGLPFIDLYPAVARKTAGIPLRMQWANPANGHPGDTLTTIFADSVFAYLRDNWLRPF